MAVSIEKAWNHRQAMQIDLCIDFLPILLSWQFRHGDNLSILDDQGKRIGVWYSIITAPTSVWMKDDHTAVIYTPDIDTYIRYERDSG